MNKYTYTGSKIQNHFTAYLIQFVRGKRHDYLEKKIQMADAEELLEEYWTDGGKNCNRRIDGEPNEGAAFIAGGTGKISGME